MVPCAVIEVGSVTQHTLTLLECLILLFNATITPIIIAYGSSKVMLWLSTGIDFVYLLLMICKLRTSYYNE